MQKSSKNLRYVFCGACVSYKFTTGARNLRPWEGKLSAVDAYSNLNELACTEIITKMRDVNFVCGVPPSSDDR